MENNAATMRKSHNGDVIPLKFRPFREEVSGCKHIQGLSAGRHTIARLPAAWREGVADPGRVPLAKKHARPRSNAVGAPDSRCTREEVRRQGTDRDRWACQSV